MKTIKVLVDELYKRKEKIPGVLSFKKAADMFAKLWCEKNSLKCNLFRKERIYQLERVSKKYLGDKPFSNATEAHKELMLQWAGEMMKEALVDAEDEDIERAIKTYADEFAENKSSFYILFDNSFVPYI